jgi:hypothetical protein
MGDEGRPELIEVFGVCPLSSLPTDSFLLAWSVVLNLE